VNRKVSFHFSDCDPGRLQDKLDKAEAKADALESYIDEGIDGATDEGYYDG